jgi:hypothetical protein
MRYQIQLATSVDVAFLAAVIDEDGAQVNGQGEDSGIPLDRLLQTCVTPVSDDPEVGHLWMLACEAFDNDPGELGSLSRLVFGEMLGQFPRLENYVDARKVRALELLRSIGFAVEPAIPRPAADADFHRVWIDSDRLLIGGAASLLPN